MSEHILVIDVDTQTRKLLDEGHLMYPEHLDDRHYSVLCPHPDECNGWMECLRQHICPHGHSAGMGFEEMSSDGPCPGHDNDNDPNCYSGYDEFNFHGEWHTYRYGWGWTTEWPGCVVADADIDFYYLPVERLPRGEYPVNDDWDDTYCTLELIEDAA